MVSLYYCSVCSDSSWDIANAQINHTVPTEQFFDGNLDHWPKAQLNTSRMEMINAPAETKALDYYRYHVPLVGRLN